MYRMLGPDAVMGFIYMSDVYYYAEDFTQWSVDACSTCTLTEHPRYVPYTRRGVFSARLH